MGNWPDTGNLDSFKIPAQTGIPAGNSKILVIFAATHRPVMPVQEIKSMKKRILIILAVLVVAFLAIGSIFGYQMYRKYGLGEVPLKAVESAIPEAPGILMI